MKTLLLIDGNAIFHRAFHALPLLTDAKGNYTNAVYGFMRMLFEIIKKEKPNYLAIAFDHKDKTFRHYEFAQYKATRTAPPAELYPQLPILMGLLENLNIRFFRQSGYEADDIIGTLTNKVSEYKNLETLILTGDKDAFQLINEHVRVIMPHKGVKETVTYDQALVKNKVGIRPDQIIDYKALRGDTSDNIPGVKGIGEKQAVEMLQKYENLDEIYRNLNNLPPARRRKMEKDRDMAYLSKKMATIIRDMPIKFDLQECNLEKMTIDRSRTALMDFGFKTLLKLLDDMEELLLKRQYRKIQPSLFD